MRKLALALLFVPALAFADDKPAESPPPPPAAPVAPAPVAPPKILELPAPPTLAIHGNGRDCTPNALGQAECKPPPKQQTPSAN